MQGPVGGYYGPNQMRSDLRVLQSQVADVLVARNPAARVAALLDTARKLAGNIADAPAAERFRRVKKTNALITERVLGVEGGAQFMLVLGWEECEKGGGAFVCPPDADMDGMAQGLGVLAERLHRSGGGPAAPSPAVAELCQLASIPEAYARQLLEQHGMQLDKAVEAYFADAANGVVVRDPAPGGAPAAAAASSSAPVPVPTPPPRGRPAAPRRAPAAPAPAPAVPLPVPAEHIAEECSRLVSAIDQKKDERARARAAHPASVEAQANAVVEALVADGAAARAGAAAKVNALVKLRLAVTGAEEKAVLTNNILALLALSDDAAHRASLPGELRSLEGQLAALDADPAVAAMARSFAQPFASSSSTTTPATKRPPSNATAAAPAAAPLDGDAAGLLPLQFVAAYNVAAQQVRGAPIQALTGFAHALRVAKEHGWARAAYHALGGIAAGNLALNNVSGAENALRQRGGGGAPPAEQWAAKVPALGRYGAYAALAHPVALQAGGAADAAAAGPAAHGLRKDGGGLPLLCCLMTFKFTA